MNKTELLNKLAREGEERILLARAMDKLEAAEQKNIPACTAFLSPHESEAVSRLIAACGHPRHLFFGGYDGAERRVCLFLPDWMEDGRDAFDEDGPLAALRATWYAGDSLSHRDFLGALMGMGVTRESVGDILVGEGTCDLILLREVSGFLCQSMESAGRVKLKLAPIALSELQPPQAQVKVIRDTVAALRLDAVAAAGFSISRSKAADYISAGRVALNWQECAKPDRPVAQGDTISCRGLGKCVVTQVGGQSRKGRIMLVLERYI
jgi:RNA-binding protein YlmH